MPNIDLHLFQEQASKEFHWLLAEEIPVNFQKHQKISSTNKSNKIKLYPLKIRQKKTNYTSGIRTSSLPFQTTITYLNIISNFIMQRNVLERTTKIIMILKLIKRRCWQRSSIKSRMNKTQYNLKLFWISSINVSCFIFAIT